MRRPHPRPVLLASGLMLLLAAPIAGVAGDWTEFRGPSRQGISDATTLPLEWSESKHVAWKVEVPGKAWSSPVVRDDRIYLTTAVPDDTQAQSLRVLALDASTGQTVWNVEVFHIPGGQDVEVHQKNSHASPTPVLDGDRIFVHFGPHGTACLEADGGRVVWQTQELQYRPNHGNGGSPALAGDHLVICCDGQDIQFVAALHKQTGDVVWRTPRDTEPERGFSFCTPLVINVNGQSQAICPGSDAVFAYDPATGAEIWRVRYGSGYSVVPRPVEGNGLVYVCSGFGDARLLAIDPTGRGDITESHVKWTMDKGVPKTPSPLLVGGELYLVDDRGIATCADATTGEIYWQERLGGNFSASPTYAAGRVYFQDENGGTTVVRAGQTFESLARNDLAEGERTFASFAIVESAILLRSERHLYRIDD